MNEQEGPRQCVAGLGLRHTDVHTVNTVWIADVVYEVALAFKVQQCNKPGLIAITWLLAVMMQARWDTFLLEISPAADISCSLLHHSPHSRQLKGLSSNSSEYALSLRVRQRYSNINSRGNSRSKVNSQCHTLQACSKNSISKTK